MYFKAFLKPSLSYTARYAPSLWFQKRLKIHAKIAQLILLPLLYTIYDVKVKMVRS